MTVKDVLIEAVVLAGREDLAANLTAGSRTDETVLTEKAFLTYFNAVVDELARGYFILDKEQEMASENCRYAFADFEYGPTRINRVTDEKNEIEWRVYPGYLYANAKKIAVKYEYAPAKAGLSDEFAYPDPAVGARLVEYGMVAEYFLVNGDGANYNLWENRYREEIDRLLSRRGTHGRIPPRRWI